jgi:hypothetical protein
MTAALTTAGRLDQLSVGCLSDNVAEVSNCGLHLRLDLSNSSGQLSVGWIHFGAPSTAVTRAEQRRAWGLDLDDNSTPGQHVDEHKICEPGPGAVHIRHPPLKLRLAETK